jgi:hypothetical protein
MIEHYVKTIKSIGEVHRELPGTKCQTVKIQLRNNDNQNNK